MLVHAPENGTGLSPELATAAMRWRPQSSLGRRGEGRRGTARGEVGPEAAEVPREAAGEAGGGLRPPSAALKQRGREVEERVCTSLQNPKISGVPL